jgi:CRP-like cAMP-binding protein
MAVDKEKYSAILRQLIPVNELPENLQNEFISKVTLTEFKKRKFIFNQGDRDELSYYLVEGEIELLANNQLQSEISSGSDRARYAMAQLQPRQFSAKAKTLCVIAGIPRNEVDKLLVLQGESSNDDDDDDDMTNIDVTTVDLDDSGDDVE